MTTSKKNFEKEYPRVHSMLEELKKQNKELIWDKLSLAKKNEELKENNEEWIATWAKENTERGKLNEKIQELEKENE